VVLSKSHISPGASARPLRIEAACQFPAAPSQWMGLSARKRGLWQIPQPSGQVSAPLGDRGCLSDL